MKRPGHHGVCELRLEVAIEAGRQLVTSERSWPTHQKKVLSLQQPFVVPCKCGPASSKGMCHHTSSSATRDRGLERKEQVDHEEVRYVVGLHLRFGIVSRTRRHRKKQTSHRPLRTARRCRSNSGNRSAPWSTKLKGQPLQSLSGSGPVAGTFQQHASGFFTSTWQRMRGSQLHLSCQSPQCTAQRNSPWRPHAEICAQRA